MSTNTLTVCFRTAKTIFQRNLTIKCHRQSFRSFTKNELQDIYEKAKNICYSKKPPRDVNPNGVFACNELQLDDIAVYGFDYDFTLACYKPAMDYLLYSLGRDVLVNKFMGSHVMTALSKKMGVVRCQYAVFGIPGVVAEKKYPKEILQLEYQPDFAIRGLHYDIEKGVLMKLDSFLQIQLGTVYKGLTPVPDHAVLKFYKNRVIPLAYVEGSGKLGGSSKLHQLADLFSMPEMGLLCNITEYFVQQQIDCHPEILFRDVRNAIGSIHPVMHQEVVNNPAKYLDRNPSIREFFSRLVSAKKKLFLITNSPFRFVDAGMSLIVGADWTEFFDIVIVQARKPKFFTDESRPLRMYDKESNAHLWDRVVRMEKGIIYCEGTIRNLQEMTGWTGDEVLYFGDHPYSDLADATLEHGWRTGAIIHELTHEIDALNTPEFKKDSNWCHMLTQIIEDCQDHAKDGEAAEILNRWVDERQQLLNKTKAVFNPQFGSVFRTFTNPTFFSRRLFRFADIYTSNVTNLLQYSTRHSFFPRRGALPHEYASLFM